MIMRLSYVCSSLWNPMSRLTTKRLIFPWEAVLAQMVTNARKCFMVPALIQEWDQYNKMQARKYICLSNSGAKIFNGPVSHGALQWLSSNWVLYWYKHLSLGGIFMLLHDSIKKSRTIIKQGVVGTKWSPFHRPHLQRHTVRRILYFDSTFNWRRLGFSWQRINTVQIVTSGFNMFTISTFLSIQYSSQHIFISVSNTEKSLQIFEKYICVVENVSI